MSQTLGYAALDPNSPLAPYSFSRREVGPNDVKIDILYCGVCHSDLHTARNEWNNTLYPSVPGHEIVGRVTAVGSAVSAFKVGDVAGVGCLVDSCRTCSSCGEGLEQYCENGFVGTYNGPAFGGGENTLGGYSDNIVVDEKYVLRISHTDNLAAVAPLLCAGITTYSPLRQWKVGPGQKVGVVGLGGLGHMAVKIANAMGAKVVLFTTSPDKREDALRLGASEVVVSKNKDEMAAHVNSFDFILNTVAAPHNLDAFVNLLKRDATMTLVGAPAAPHPSPSVFGLIFKRRRIAGSLIGGIAETQEMLDFCAEHGIGAVIETIGVDEVDSTYDRVVNGEVYFRAVIDTSTFENA